MLVNQVLNKKVDALENYLKLSNFDAFFIDRVDLKHNWASATVYKLTAGKLAESRVTVTRKLKISNQTRRNRLVWQSPLENVTASRGLSSEASTMTFSHNPNGTFLVTTAQWFRARTPTSYTYNGVSTTQAVYSNNNYDSVIYYLASPSSGANNAVLTLSGTSGYRFGYLIVWCWCFTTWCNKCRLYSIYKCTIIICHHNSS